jgi:signal transduction histidine kinase
LSERTPFFSDNLKLNLPATVAAYLVYGAVIARTMSIKEAEIQSCLPWYLGLFSIFLILFTVVLWQPHIHPIWCHLYFVFQSVVVLALISLPAHLDFLTTPFVLLSFQVGLVFTGRTRLAWIGTFVFLTGGSLVFYMGVLRGLALGLIPMAFCIVYPAYITVNHEIEKARVQSQVMLDKLQETHRQLKVYTDQVEELATMEERNRLAREIHDSVSQTMFSIVLNIRSTQILLQRDPARVRPQLEQLRELTQNVLTDMRNLIGKLRPKDS